MAFRGENNNFEHLPFLEQYTNSHTGEKEAELAFCKMGTLVCNFSHPVRIKGRAVVIIMPYFGVGGGGGGERMWGQNVFV